MWFNLRSCALLIFLIAFGFVKKIFADVNFPAKNVSCHRGSIGCPTCSHDMMLFCDNGQHGHVGRDVRASAVRLNVTDSNGNKVRTLTLNGPVPNHDDELRDWLDVRFRAELKSGEVANLDRNAFVYESSVELYRDKDGKESLGKLGGSKENFQQATTGIGARWRRTINQRRTSMFCVWQTEPLVLKQKKGCGISGGDKMCFGKIICHRNGSGPQTVDVACNMTRAPYTSLMSRLAGSSRMFCPSANECAADSDVEISVLEDPKPVETPAPQESGRSRASER